MGDSAPQPNAQNLREKKPSDEITSGGFVCGEGTTSLSSAYLRLVVTGKIADK
jgi:hypothetical protein